jgi:FixJ family two-component response regulator
LIVVVDDDEAIRIAAASLIRSLGLVVRTFASAEEFLSADIAAKISCLVSDVYMPGISGLDLPDVLLARGQRTPIIFITAYLDERIENRAQAVGAAGLFVKPFDGQGLADCIMEVLRKEQGL